MLLDKYLDLLTSTTIGRRACVRLSSKQFLQAQLAVATSLLAFAASSASIVFAQDYLPGSVFFVAVSSLLMFASVVPIYRYCVPRWPWALPLANNMIPAALCLCCGYSAIYLGGSLTLSAIYASAIPLLSVMICRPPLANLWSLLMVLVLLAGMLVEPAQQVQSPAWLTLLGGITVVIPTLVSMLLHRRVWENALHSEELAQQQIREQHESQRLLDRKLSEFERQESLGLVAGRTAHEFNNLLTAVVGSVELAKSAVHDGEWQSVEEHLETIDVAANNACQLSRQLLDYTGKAPHTIVPVDLSNRVRSAMVLAQAACLPGTQLQLEIEDDIWVAGDPVQLDQVLVNLVRNAAQSYEPRTGLVRVVLRSEELESVVRCESGTLSLSPGCYAKLDVEDFGCGIPEKHFHRIFEPLFTNRPEGTGLGLSAVSGIASAHGGGIRVVSSVGEGSQFALYLPAEKPSIDGLAGSPCEGEEDLAKIRTILVVDDEQLVRKTLGRLVQHIGFGVQFAEDGLQAIQRMEEHPDVSAIIMDISMPHMDGYQALRKIRTLNASLPVLLISGYSGIQTKEHADDMFTNFLAKPFSAKGLEEGLCALGVIREPTTVGTAVG